MPSAIGLDIGSSAVRAVQVTRPGRGPATLDRLGQVLLPPGAVRDGEIADPEAVVEVLKTLWKRYGFKGRKVAMGVANQQVVVREVDLPYLPEAELRKSLDFQVQDYIPIPVEQAVLDFHVLAEHEVDGNRLSKILLVAAARGMVDSVVAAARQARLQPMLLDLDAFAMLRSLSRPDAVLAGGEGELLVDAGAAVTNLVVHEAGIPRFVRILLMGGKDVTDAVAERMGISQEQAESLKQQLGVRSGTDLEPGDKVALRALEASAEVFVEEIRGSLAYYSASQGAAPVSRVIVSGGGMRLAGLLERLGEATRLPVAAGNPLAALTLGGTGLTPEQITYVEPLSAVPVGLALGAQ